MRRPTRPLLTALARGILPLATFLVLGACKDAGSSLGGAPVASAKAGDAIGALGARFGPVQLEPRAVAARERVSRAAFAPSRIWDDSALWTTMRADMRAIELAGEPAGQRYRIGVAARTALPREAGDYRRLLQLRRTGQESFEWRAIDELAIGEITVADIDRAIDAVLRAAGTSSDAALRRELASSLPAATALVSAFAALDSLRLTPAPGGASIRIVATLRPDRLRTIYPKWADYLEDYAAPAEMTFSVTDDGGATWFDGALRAQRLTLQGRVAHGTLAPLAGPSRPVPPRLWVTMDASARIGIFRVGAKRMRAALEHRLTDREWSLTVTSREEPKWAFPPLVAATMRAPLRHPFEGEGVTMRFAVRDGAPGRSTIASRDYRFAVRENTVVRWLGSLGSDALGEYRDGADREADDFVGRLAGALRADLHRLWSDQGT